MGLLNKIWVKISGDSTELQGTLKSSEKSVSSWAKRIAGFIGIAFGSKALVDFSVECMKLAAETEGIKTAFSKMGGETKKILEEMGKATRGVIPEAELMQMYLKAQSLGIPFKDLGTYLTFATNQAIRLGKPVAEFAGLMINAVGRQSSRGLVQIGLATKEANSAFQTSDGLIGLVNDKLKQMGDVADTASIRMERVGTKWTEAKEAWGTFINNSPAVQSLVKWLGDIATIFADKDLSIWQKLNGTPDQYAAFKKNQEETNKNAAQANRDWMNKNFPSSMGFLDNLANKPAAPEKEKIKTIEDLTKEISQAEEGIKGMNAADVVGISLEQARIANLKQYLSLLQAGMMNPNILSGATKKVTPDMLNIEGGALFNNTGLTKALQAGMWEKLGGVNGKGQVGTPLAPMKEAVAKDLNEVEKLFQDGKKALVDLAMDTVQNLFAAMSSGNWGDFGKSLLEGIADFLSMMGKLLISYAMASMAFMKTLQNPAMWPVALAAGISMIAIAGLIKGAISKGSQSYSSGAMSTGGGASMGATTQNLKVIVEGKIQGKDIYISSRRYADSNSRST